MSLTKAEIIAAREAVSMIPKEADINDFFQQPLWGNPGAREAQRDIGKELYRSPQEWQELAAQEFQGLYGEELEKARKEFVKRYSAEMINKAAEYQELGQMGSTGGMLDKYSASAGGIGAAIGALLGGIFGGKGGAVIGGLLGGIGLYAMQKLGIGGDAVQNFFKGAVDKVWKPGTVDTNKIVTNLTEQANKAAAATEAQAPKTMGEAIDRQNVNQSPVPKEDGSQFEEPTSSSLPADMNAFQAAEEATRKQVQAEKAAKIQAAETGRYNPNLTPDDALSASDTRVWGDTTDPSSVWDMQNPEFLQVFGQEAVLPESYQDQMAMLANTESPVYQKFMNDWKTAGSTMNAHKRKMAEQAGLLKHLQDQGAPPEQIEQAKQNYARFSNAYREASDRVKTMTTQASRMRGLATKAREGYGTELAGKERSMLDERNKAMAARAEAIKAYEAVRNDPNPAIRRHAEKQMQAATEAFKPWESTNVAHGGSSIAVYRPNEKASALNKVRESIEQHKKTSDKPVWIQSQE